MESGSSSGAHGRHPSLEYMEVRRIDEFKVAENIRQGGVCCVLCRIFVQVWLRIDLEL